ncbi:FAD binding domain-containing protein [Sphaerisporangium perillae]|uniref:FAD binding domain-containing protein n=1 Tax=Sphaerisporangium perillae TaxID=2935860 RepID=UPI00200C443E|nr:FAD binding domain-containing protein [Sphaerisporangium perillae]
MKPPAFDYHAPRGLGEALEVLAGAGPHGKVLAGGQSLIPLLNMRLASPSHLVDINRVAELDTLVVADGGVRVGALARHAAVERSSSVARAQPLLRTALKLVAHPVIRNRGTVIGSLVHADPSAELPAVLTVLSGSVRLARHGGGERDVPAGAFFTGPLESAVEPGELAVSAFFPSLPPRTGSAFCEVARRHGDYAMAGAAAVVGLDEDLRIVSAKVACVSVGPVPVLLEMSEVCAHRPAASVDWAAVAASVRERIDPEGDIHATAAYRRHLTGVLAERALRIAAQEAAGEQGREGLDG